jgi:hypothetical protein
MNERERIENEHNPPPSSEGLGENNRLQQIRQTANEFLAAGDEAIRRALSGDSEGFLRANRQQGGQ